MKSAIWILILLIGTSVVGDTRPAVADAATPWDLFAKDNLVAWCIVSFDAKQRGPGARAEMLQKLGIKKVAYDWREHHVPTFEEEILQYKQHHLEYFAFWSWHEDMGQLIVKHEIRPQIWRTLGGGGGTTRAEKVESAARALLPMEKKSGLRSI